MRESLTNFDEVLSAEEMIGEHARHPLSLLSLGDQMCMMDLGESIDFLDAGSVVMEHAEEHESIHTNAQNIEASNNNKKKHQQR
jgi:hypothetical protein